MPNEKPDDLILIKGSNNVDDVLTGTDEDELIRGFSGNDQLFGRDARHREGSWHGRQRAKRGVSL